MSDIAHNIIALKQQIPLSVKLVAVSKTKSAGEILEAYNAGHRAFGENRVQELLSKKDILPPDIEWHLIGHLQTNKVRYIVPFVSLVHSIDSFRLLEVVNAEALKIGKVVNCLLQFHIAEEETKFGFDMDEAERMMESHEFMNLKSVSICGVMGMATFTDNLDLVRKEFRTLSGYYKRLKDKYFHDIDTFREISMGMSGDFRVAIEEGSTIIRIGTIIFGERI
jgi:pyridoxal phosphate enzyme (YggS family)